MFRGDGVILSTMDAQTILVIILSGTLALFLILSIIAMVFFIIILKHLKAIAEKAEHIADSAEAVGDFFKHSSQSLSVAKLFAGVYETVKKKTKSGGKK